MKNAGFTFIEFLVVAAIVGLILAVAIPAVNKISAKSYDTEWGVRATDNEVSCKHEEGRFCAEDYKCGGDKIRIITDTTTGEQWLFYRGCDFNSAYFGIAPVTKQSALEKPE